MTAHVEPEQVIATDDVDDAGDDSPKTPGRFWVRIRRNKIAMAGLAYLILISLVAIFAPYLTSHDAIFATRFQDILFSPGEGGYILGTDHVGRDLLTRIMFGARYALIAGLEAVAVALVIGVPLGLTIGYFRGWVDRIIMRGVETVVAVREGDDDCARTRPTHFRQCVLRPSETEDQGVFGRINRGLAPRRDDQSASPTGTSSSASIRDPIAWRTRSMKSR